MVPLLVLHELLGDAAHPVLLELRGVRVDPLGGGRPGDVERDACASVSYSWASGLHLPKLQGHRDRRCDLLGEAPAGSGGAGLLRGLGALARQLVKQLPVPPSPRWTASSGGEEC